uniref:1,3-beta-glucan synthase n=1 Tax=Oryza barthii TaxID=65489 RepID=A0A0D3F323_9ORYZ
MAQPLRAEAGLLLLLRLCARRRKSGRFHAFEKAHMMDPRSTGRGVRQFKTALLQRLEQDEKSTFTKRMAKSDSQEIRLFYEKKEKADERELLPVLAEVLRAVQIGTGMEKQKRIASETFADKSALFRYNILPLYPGSTKQPIMLLPEEKKGNVANQREHLILLLANMHARLNPKSSSETMLDDRAVDELLAKTFENYLTWCKFLGRKSNIWLPSVKQEIQQHKLLYISLYLLIWGEASNLRLMPECLCYIFHHESLKNKNGVSDHSTWRNYDDLNEFFWLDTMLYWVIAFANCFKLGWPMRLNNDFFFTSNKNKNSRLPIVPPVQQTEQQIAQLRTSQQTDQQNTQLRTSQQTEQQNTQLRTPNGSSSFQNMLNPEAPEQTQQVLIIMAWHGLESPLQLLDPIIFQDVLSIFITNAVLRVIQVILDITFSWRTKSTMRFSQKLRFAVKLSIAVAWAIILPIFYASSQNYFSCSARQPKTFLGIFCLSKYMVVVALYLTSNVIGMALFFVPAVYFMDTQIWYSVFCTIFGEMDLMTMPMSLEHRSGSIRWPMFLLAKKFSEAVDMVANFTGKSTRLFCIIKKDNYMLCAINDFYELTKSILRHLVIGDVEKSFSSACPCEYYYDVLQILSRVIAAIYIEIEKSIQNASLLVDFKMDHLPSLVAKFDRLAELLYTNKQELRYEVTILLQDIIDILVQDMLVDAQSVLGLINSSETLISDDDGTFEYYKPELFASISSISNIRFPFPENGPLKEQVKRLYLLLNTKDKVVEVPSNLEARRRISFFATSLFMDMPSAPKVSNEWRNFLERLGPKVTQEEIRYWASFHGQTLSRTVRGMMYYRKALRLQAFLDRTNDQELYKGPAANGRQTKNMHQSLSTELDALADMKFSYVISCQKFGEQKSSGNPHAQDIIDLMTRYPALRVAYIEEKEIIVDNRPHKVYSSVLIKAENNLDQEIYRIKLPGPPLIGEGKPENQNHAIIFTRGEALQTIDMNQDNYLEEAYKMRNVLQEFVRHPRGKAPTILGLREHIFTGSVSSLAGFMSYQETSFVTIGQRFLADPLRVRFHYGHPDIFDRMFHLTRGGISKASKTINLSEDVFAGYNSILRRGHITYNEYIQVGKGRDVGLNQISKFEAKVANGNSEQTLSRDIHRLGRRFDFFRMLSCYFTTVGFYFNSLISVVGVYVFLYGQLYLVLSGLQRALLIEAETQNMKSLETALVSQSFLQLGLLTGLPMVMELGLEKGFRVALSDFILMQLQLASVFFTFSLGTKAHYYGRTILHGGAKYRPTGRKFVAFHASFTENYQLYSRSHFVKGFELVFLLIIYHIFRRSYVSTVVHVMITYSTWFMAVTWLFAPFLFNPAGFAWRKIVEDWADWTIWMRNQGGIGVQPEKSWESWWNAENAHLRHSVLSSRILEVLLSLRFFIYQYGLVYHLKISQDNKNFLVYLLSWVVIIAIVGLVKLVNCASRRLSSKHQLIFRLIKLLIFLSVMTSLILLSCLCQLSIMDLIICCLAFIPTGWGLLLIVQVLRPKIEYYAIWEPIQVIAHAYDYGMGSLLFFPIAALAWMPVISAIQTRVLFNRAFSRQLQIQPFIAGKTKRR